MTSIVKIKIIKVTASYPTSTPKWTKHQSWLILNSRPSNRSWCSRWGRTMRGNTAHALWQARWIQLSQRRGPGRLILRGLTKMRSEWWTLGGWATEKSWWRRSVRQDQMHNIKHKPSRYCRLIATTPKYWRMPISESKCLQQMVQDPTLNSQTKAP